MHSASNSAPVVLDVEHLAQYTRGDRVLEAELLALYQAQARPQLREVCRAALEKDAAGWKFALHTLKGMSRALGAGLVAEAAAKLEKMPPGQTGIRELEQQLAALERAILQRKG